MRINFSSSGIPFGEYDLWHVNEDQGWPVWTLYEPSGAEVACLTGYVPALGTGDGKFVCLKNHDEFLGAVTCLKSLGIVRPEAYFTMHGEPALFVCEILANPKLPLLT